MILVFLTLTILLIVVGVILGIKNDWDTTYEMPPLIIGAIGFFLVAIVTIFLMYNVSSAKVIDEKIAMYQTENEKIETQIAEVVQQYQEYEQGTFDKVAPDKAVTLVSLYPELKSDELVSKQIAIYVDNNNKIKELKEDKINASVDRWWLYFGG
jgi:hypothetical protein